MLPFDTAGIQSSLRFCQVMGDGMTPTIGLRDYVLVTPKHRYTGEGYYLVSNTFGDAEPFSCSAAGTRKEPMIRLHRHNKHYSDQLVSKQWFDEHVLAQVVMICNVVRPDVLAEAARRNEVEA